jgi:ankyrin repeat protein
LDDLPRSLDGTHGRVVLEIAAEKRNYAHRLFKCLVVSVRPLRVQELSKTLAIRFDGSPPTNKTHWLPETPEEVVLSACSSLVAVVNVDGSSVVQFSHFSVREFLTSECLLNTGRNLSGLYILPHSTNTTFAKDCLCVLLDGHSDKNGMESSSLFIYAARHWVYHSQFDTLAILCRFCDIIEYLVLTPPSLVNAKGGYYAIPLHATVTTGNVNIMRLLFNNGNEVNTLDDQGWSPLHRLLRSGDLDILKLFLEHQADVDILGNDEESLLFLTSHDGNVQVARILLRIGVVWLSSQNGAAVDSQDDKCWPPLQLASQYGHLDVVQEFVSCGANVDAQKHDFWTVSHLAPDVGNIEIAEALFVHGAAVDMKNTKSETPLLDLGSGSGELRIAWSLIKRGADATSRDNRIWTPMHTASWNGRLDVVRLLLESLTDIGIQNENLRTPLALASHNGQLDVSRLLIEHGADVDSSDDAGWTLLHWTVRFGHLDIVQLLLDNSTAVDMQREIIIPWTPLHPALANGDLNIADWLFLLIRNGADVDKAYTNQGTPLPMAYPVRWASGCEQLKIARLIAKYRSKNSEFQGFTVAAQNGYLDVVKSLLERGADVNTQNLDNMTSLNLASRIGKLAVARFLAERMRGILDTLDHDGADVDLTLQKRRSDIMHWRPSFSSSHDRPCSDGEAIASLNIASQFGDHDILHSSKEDLNVRGH